MDAAIRLKDTDLIPQLGRESLQRNEGRRSEDYAEASRSVVMFADLSGFSALGARLVAASDRGAEELRDLINAIFEQVVGVISQHGGSILYYAGDAIAAAWPHRQSDLASIADNVIACGIATQAACDMLSAEPGAGKFEMSVSIAEGDVWIAHLADSPGGPRLVFCGEVLEAFGAGAQRLERNGVLIAPALLAELMPALVERATVERDTAGARVLSIVPPATRCVRHDAAAAAGLECYVPGPVRTHLNQTSTRWVAEFRSAHVLFARFANFSFAGRVDLGRLSALAAGALGAVEASGGALVQLVRDDKGLVLLAGWGLASSAFENGAERAVSAANAIAEAARGLGLDAKVAVTAGKVFAGLVGARPLFQYVMVGDAVNRAAGMAVRAPAAVTIDEATRADVARRYVCVLAGELSLKGHAAPLPVYAPAGEVLAGATHEGALIGRVAERRRLEALLDELRRGIGADIHIFGDAGLGKSRLASWFEQRLGEAGVPCLRMNADGLRQTTGYIPWKQIFAPLLGLTSSATGEECDAAVRASLGSDEQALPLLPLLTPVLPGAVAETDFTATLVGAGRAESTRSVVLKLLAAALAGADAPGVARVLLVEDAHWLDSASWQLLEAAERQFPDLALLIVSRPLDLDNLPSEARRLFAAGAAETLQLEPLARDEATSLICQALDVVEAAQEIVDVVHREAEGHPLFTTAFAHSLHERGRIRIQGGYAHLRLGEASPGSLMFPDGIEGVVTERISALTPARQLVVKVAAVLGRHFDVDALADLHPDAPGAGMLDADLEAIAATGLIETVGTEPGRYRFHHAIIADAAYRLLLTEQRRGLHEAAGRRIEALTGAKDAAPDQATLAMLAHHYEQAGRTAKALDYLARAAETARVGYNNAEVADFLSRAMLIAERDEAAHVDALTLGQWKYTIAEALRALGRYQRAEEFLKQSAAILDRPPPETGLQATSWLLRGYAGFRLGRHRPPQPDAARRQLLTAAAANMTLSEIHYELNKIPFALSEILRGANLARAAGGDSAVLSKLYIGMALIATLLPWALDGDELQRQSLAIADRLGDPATTSWVYMVSGVYETGKGGWSTGDEHLNRSREIGERCGERKNWETAMSCLGNLKRLEGRFAEAKGWSDLTLQASRDRGIVHGIIWSHNGRARDLLCMSDFDGVRAEVQALDKLLRDPAKKLDSNDNNNLVYLFAGIFCALEAADDNTALAKLDTLMGILARIKRPQVYMVQNVDYYSDIIWNLWKRGHRSQRLLAHQSLIARSGRRVARQYRTGLPMAELAAGDGAWYRGKPVHAARHWRASAAAAKARGMGYSAAHALFRLHESGLAGTEDRALDWQQLVAELKIPRPALWSLD